MSPVLAAEMKNMTFPQVVLILGLSTLLATVIIWLSIIGKDPVEVVSGIAPILLLVGGAFGWAKVNELKRDVGDVKELSNGRLTEAREDLKAVQEDNKVLHSKVAALSMLLQPGQEEPK